MNSSHVSPTAQSDSPIYSRLPIIDTSGDDPGSAAAEETGPHGALFLVLAYLGLPDLFSFQQVCRLFRDAIAEDSLLWRHITVEPPLSGRLTDSALLRITSKAGGKLSSLELMNCWNITDAGLLRVAEENPNITKLYVPGCTHLTGDGLVRVVERLSVQKGKMKLRLHSIGIITREHLDILSSFLPENSLQQGSKPFFYSYERAHSLEIDDGRPIDVAICPNCKNVLLVFDCTRKTCRDAINDFRSKNPNLSECRGCLFCITRCEECGGCLDFDEFEDAACPDFLCTECWLHLPKCNMCNRPYCKRHLNSEVGYFGSAGFTCEQCRDFEDSSYGCI